MNSQEEDEPRFVKPIATVPVKYSWVSSPTTQFFGPSSLLSTIVEEDEENLLACHNIIISGATNGVPILSPPAVIVNSKIGEEAVFPPASKVPKKRWFSMIENNAKRHEHSSVGSSEGKRLSAPAAVLGPSRMLARTGSITLDRPKSTAKPLNLPQRVVMKRALNSAFRDAGDNSGFLQESPTFCELVDSGLPSLPSSRSSNCISLYQRPWSLYVPGEATRNAQTSLIMDIDSSESRGAEDPVTSNSTSSASSSPTFSEVETPDAAALTLGSEGDRVGVYDSTESIDLGQDTTFHLFAECSSSEYQGVGGILAILDTLNLSTTNRYSQAIGSPKPCSSAGWEGVSESGLGLAAGGALGTPEECGVATTQHRCSDWRDSDFMAYYEGPSCASVEGTEEGALAFCQ